MMSLNDQSIQAYLARIGYRAKLGPTLTTLRDLHCAHLLTVPFENLDIHRGRQIVLDEALLYDKIVRRRRGGFCYELNGLFAVLLRHLGFDVTLLSAGVARAAGGFGPDYDHLALLVKLDEPWLVDVGFGDSFREPLRFGERGPQVQAGDEYLLEDLGKSWRMKRRKKESAWGDQYEFTLVPRQLEDFKDMCRYHQTSPESTFTQKRVCSRATPNGRVSLSEKRLIVTDNGNREERELSDEEYARILRELFGFELSD